MSRWMYCASLQTATVPQYPEPEPETVRKFHGVSLQPPSTVSGGLLQLVSFSRGRTGSQAQKTSSHAVPEPVKYPPSSQHLTGVTTSHEFARQHAPTAQVVSHDM